VKTKVPALSLVVLVSVFHAATGNSAEIILPEHGCRTAKERKDFAIKLFEYFKRMDVGIPALTEEEGNWYRTEEKRLDDRLQTEAGTKKYLADWDTFDNSKVRFLLESKKLVRGLTRSIKTVVDEADDATGIQAWIFFANELVYSQKEWHFLKGLPHKDKRVNLDWHLTIDGSPDVGEPDKYLLLAIHNAVLIPYIWGQQGAPRPPANLGPKHSAGR
jgi:hypothetical protein